MAPTASETAATFIPTVEKAEAARAAGMQGLYRTFVNRSLDVLRGEIERGGDERLALAVEVVQGIRSRERQPWALRHQAATTLAQYAGSSDAVSHAAAVAFGVVQRKRGKDIDTIRYE